MSIDFFHTILINNISDILRNGFFYILVPAAGLISLGILIRWVRCYLMGIGNKDDTDFQDTMLRVGRKLHLRKRD